MKAIMVMFDSLNRRYLPPYGCEWVVAPNFRRLAQRSVRFDNCYGGSMPCMPARRELHTGRYNFLHRSWGPLEPFDVSMPELLKNSGVYTHLVTDHYHYWEDGGATYHNRYSSWEGVRGQEGDRWKGLVSDPPTPDNLNRPDRQDWVNRSYMTRESDMPQNVTFEHGLHFIRSNADDDQWFIQLETFDPHEPFFSQNFYKRLYDDSYSGPLFDWPEYKPVSESEKEVEHCRYEYAALVSMCDRYLGRVLDLMDELELWEDTMLIVNTDHGFSLGEHGWWAKGVQPFYNEIIHTPLFIWDPRSGIRGESRESLVQTIDLPVTLLRYFDIDVPVSMQGGDLSTVLESDESIRQAALFGTHGFHVNCTDGRYVYMKAPENTSTPLYNYTLMPTHMRRPFSADELAQAELVKGFSFTGDYPLLRTPASNKLPGGEEVGDLTDLLFDLRTDPGQLKPLADSSIRSKMETHMLELMKENDAPPELFNRYGIPKQKSSG